MYRIYSCSILKFYTLKTEAAVPPKCTSSLVFYTRLHDVTSGCENPARQAGRQPEGPQHLRVFQGIPCSPMGPSGCRLVRAVRGWGGVGSCSGVRIGRGPSAPRPSHSWPPRPPVGHRVLRSVVRSSKAETRQNKFGNVSQFRRIFCVILSLLFLLITLLFHLLVLYLSLSSLFILFSFSFSCCSLSTSLPTSPFLLLQFFLSLSSFCYTLPFPHPPLIFLYFFSLYSLSPIFFFSLPVF